MTRIECLERLAMAIAAVRRAHPTRVAIDGVDAAGKTSLADELVEFVARTGRQVIRASVDGFHRPRDVRYQRGVDSAEGYFLDSFDYATLKTVLLAPLGPLGDRRFRTAAFDYRVDQPITPPVQTAADDAILLFDGVFLQRAELAEVWDFRIWVEAPFDITVPRAVSRDATGDNGGVAAKYRSRYVPGQMLYMDQCRPRESADVIVMNADFAHPGLCFLRVGAGS
jgi:uridine kinase